MIRNQDGQPPATYKVHPWGSEGALRYGLRYTAGWKKRRFFSYRNGFEPSNYNKQICFSSISKSCGPWNYFPIASWMWRYSCFEAHKCFWLHTTTHSRANALCFDFLFINFPKCSRHQNIFHGNFEASKYFKHGHGSCHDSWFSRVSCILTMILKSLTLDPWHPSIQSHHEPRNDVATSPFRAT